MEPSHPPRHIGRIRLSEIVGDWSENHPINHRLLADEVSGVLRTLPATQVLHENIASAILYDPAAGSGGITHDALADYFDGISQGTSPETITTSTGQVRAASVLIAQHWINKVVEEATQRAKAVAGYVSVANDVTSAALMASGAPARLETPAPQPSGSAPGYLQMLQTQQRQQGEKSAGEQLETSQLRTQQLEQENTKLRAQLATREHQLQQAQEDSEEHRRAALEERRQRTLTEEQLREHFGVIEFMNPKNPLSPEEGRRMVGAWCALTKNGTSDVVTETGIGLQEHCRRWLTSNLGAPAEVVVKRFVWALAWPARKKGGMVAKQQTVKG